jgi:dTDP-4-dehydrorhamnose reductase
MKVLILGASGMLGSATFREFSADARYETWGTLRSSALREHFSPESRTQLITGVDATDQDALVSLLSRVRPDAVINCVGVIKQASTAKDPLVTLPLNSMLPHRLAHLCGLAGARLVHISTDCVFSGKKGMYVESDLSDAEDLYGKSKYMGELHDFPHAITLRTSIIGHELGTNLALVDWFLSQTGTVKGFTKAIFSGLPTVELAQVIKDLVLPKPGPSGLYHVSVDPIDKFQLLSLVAKVYGKQINIEPDDKLHIDRSLDSSRFRAAFNYQPPSWDRLITKMHETCVQP